jgi:hypothetical protein
LFFVTVVFVVVRANTTAACGHVTLHHAHEFVLVNNAQKHESIAIDAIDDENVGSGNMPKSGTTRTLLASNALDLVVGDLLLFVIVVVFCRRHCCSLLLFVVDVVDVCRRHCCGCITREKGNNGNTPLQPDPRMKLT